VNDIAALPALPLQCPRCRTSLAVGEQVHCPKCRCDFPTVGNVPILIADELSVFRTDDYVQRKATFFNKPPSRGVARFHPTPSLKPVTRRNLQMLKDSLLKEPGQRTVLVIGCGYGGPATDVLEDERLALVETDVELTARTQIVCDTHNLPFADGTFDAAIVQDVLQYTVEPYRCTAEIARVLKPEGLVYAEVAFVQQTSGGNHDFHRFTQLGVRRLFRDFAEIRSGAAMGASTTLVWSYENWLLALAGSRRLRPLVKMFARITAYPIKLLDHFLIDRAETIDAASGIYFLGRKSKHRRTDREIIASYGGAWPTDRLEDPGQDL
jgi:SAM-dependent methyltransferase